MNRLFLIFIIALCTAFGASAQGLSLMAGFVKYGPSDDGTYYNEIKRHYIDLTDHAYAARWDSEQSSRGWSWAAQYTNFGKATLDAQASRHDAPDVGGYDPVTKTCVGGTCSPEHQYLAETRAQSIALIGVKHFGALSLEAGWHYYESATRVTVHGMGTQWNHYRKQDQNGPMAGIAYKRGPWAVRYQVWQLEGRGDIPSIYVGLSQTLMVGYTFWE